MSANPMPLRRAVEIVRDFNGIQWPDLDDESECARALTILAAAVEAHEARVEGIRTDEQAKALWDELRKLERGE